MNQGSADYHNDPNDLSSAWPSVLWSIVLWSMVLSSMVRKSIKTKYQTLHTSF